MPEARREKHTLSPLSYPIEEGMAAFWTKEQLKIVAVDYQQGLLDRLNDQTKGTEYESKSVVNTVIESAKKREDALIFNYASQALNNSFFLDNLIPTTEPSMHRMKLPLQRHLTEHFGSIHQFISYMSAAAMGMMGSGWVWLVIDSQNRLATIATYGAGTMLVRERQQVHPWGAGEPPLLGGAGKSEVQGESPTVAQKEKADVGVFEREITMSTNNFEWYGVNLNPIMCISVHEHAWLHDYGVWGKETYLKRFWAVCDWVKISENHNHWVNLNLNNPESGRKRRQAGF